MRRLTIFLPGLALLALAPAPASASATAGASGLPPRLLAERGLIVWDPSAGRQHLLITAQLEAGEGPAALLVETPLRPVLEPVEPELGEALERLFALHAKEAELAFQPFPKADGAATGNVLQAADAGSLGGFLEANGMTAYGGLASFARIFGTRAFHYVALRLPPSALAPRTLPWTAISFTTPRPFYPLATPNESFVSDAPRSSRVEVYTLSPERLALTLSDFDTGLAVRLSRDDLETTLGEPLLTAFGFDDLDSPLWLQRFEAARMPLDGEDGFFVRIPEPAQKTLSTEPSALLATRHGKRLVALVLATAFAALIAWAGSREMGPDYR